MNSAQGGSGIGLSIVRKIVDLRIKMGKAAREKAEREFSLDKVVQKHLEIYQSLIKNKAD